MEGNLSTGSLHDCLARWAGHYQSKRETGGL
jgi:hypothetical protein